MFNLPCVEAYMIRQTIVADVFYPAGRVRAASEAAMLTSPLAGGERVKYAR
jgi:hypothetical protein